MLDDVKTALRRLRTLLAARTEQAYEDRDAAEDESAAETYAAGESHAYGIAEGDVRKAEEASDQKGVSESS